MTIVSIFNLVPVGPLMNPDLYILLQSLIVSSPLQSCAMHVASFHCLSKLQISVENKKYDDIKVIQPLIW